MARTPLSIVSAGMVCSLGLSVRAACAAIRASLHRFEETLFYDTSGYPITGAAIPDDALDLPAADERSLAFGEGRLARMLALAVRECATAGGPTGAQTVTGLDLRRTALWVVAPEEGRYSLPGAELGRCFDESAALLQGGSFARTGAVNLGSPGLVHALEKAGELLSSPEIDAVLIAGADSLLNAGDIDDCLGKRRLLTHDVRDGFVPGEAAACVLVTRKLPEGAGVRSLSLRGLGSAAETQTLDEQLPSRGAGLAKAIRQALDEAGLDPSSVHTRYADITAESYFFEEASYAWSRLLRAPSPPGYELVTPVTRVGHVGAAMGLVLLAMVLEGAREGWAPGPISLLHLSSSGAPRAALVVEAS